MNPELKISMVIGQCGLLKPDSNNLRYPVVWGLVVVTIRIICTLDIRK
jgi:hypothetical protein